MDFSLQGKPDLGLVQARWSFVNKDENLLTRLQNINVCLIQTSSKINIPTFDSNHSTKHESMSFNHDPHLLI